jgi:hypothetical protein
LNFRVADIQVCYELWKSRGAEFITKPIPKYGEIRCYIRDPESPVKNADEAAFSGSRGERGRF